MKAVILAGGLGTRFSEETSIQPKPMIRVGGMPMLWHIMKIYSCYDVNDFIICCGYKGYVIKEYFANYFLHQSDVTFCMKTNVMEVHRKRVEPWTVTLVDTGEHSQTGGRLARVADYIRNEQDFCLTYGDGVGNIDIGEVIRLHRLHDKEATVTATHPPGRFGALDIEDDRVIRFMEKPKGDGALINGGFFVLSPNVLKRICGDDCVWEQRPLMSLAEDNQLLAYVHHGFWHPMDTLRDQQYLEGLWRSNKAPWKMWD